MVADRNVSREQRPEIPPAAGRIAAATVLLIALAGPAHAQVGRQAQQQTTEVQVSLVDIAGNNLLVAPAGEDTAQGAVILNRNTELWVYGRGDLGFVLPGSWAELTALPSEEALVTSELTVTLGQSRGQPAFEPVNPLDPTQGITVRGTVVVVSPDQTAVQLRVGNRPLVIGFDAPVTVNLRSSTLDLAQPGALVTAEGYFVAPDRMAATRVTINLIDPLDSEEFFQAPEEENPRNRPDARRRDRPNAQDGDDPPPEGEAPPGEAPDAPDAPDAEAPDGEAPPDRPAGENGEAGEGEAADDE